MCSMTQYDVDRLHALSEQMGNNVDNLPAGEAAEYRRLSRKSEVEAEAEEERILRRWQGEQLAACVAD
jgi:hypothetical protein